MSVNSHTQLCLCWRNTGCSHTGSSHCIWGSVSIPGACVPGCTTECGPRHTAEPQYLQVHPSAYASSSYTPLPLTTRTVQLQHHPWRSLCWSCCHLPTHEAYHQLAAACAGLCIQLRCAVQPLALLLKTHCGGFDTVPCLLAALLARRTSGLGRCAWQFAHACSVAAVCSWYWLDYCL